MHGERNKYRIFVGKPEARGPLERPKIRWKFKCKKGNLFPVHAMKTYKGAEVEIPSFLTSALDGGSRLGRLNYEQQLTAPAAYEILWAPGSVWTSWKRQRPFPLYGLKTSVCPGRILL
jgi:hypothetical protein